MKQIKRLTDQICNCFLMIINALISHIYWYYRDVRYSILNRGKEDLLNRLLVAGHVVEKGITMPNRRYGFGKDVIRLLIMFCNKCIKQYGTEYNQLQLALDDLYEYRRIHIENNYELPSDILFGIENLMCYKITENISCKEYTIKEFFSECNDFKDFAYSRHTSRYFSGGVDKDIIFKAVELAKTAPSACNRQSIRVKVVSGNKKEELLNLQNGNRGFGDTIGQILLITSNQADWDYNFRTSAYLDGGIFTMNLLYALHYYKVCACTLNAHFSIKKQKKLRQITGLEKSEIPICLIAIGMPQANMMIAKSSRLDTENIITSCK